VAIQPTEADRAALAAIVDLTQQNKGRAPTLAEVTEALGFPSNSRGNIQRQLTRLRPRYVTWTTSPRSLTVTPEGVALICAGVRRQGEGPRGSDGLGVQGRIQHPISVNSRL
jgi:hypothetical protein